MIPTSVNKCVSKLFLRGFGKFGNFPCLEVIGLNFLKGKYGSISRLFSSHVVENMLPGIEKWEEGKNNALHKAPMSEVRCPFFDIFAF